MRTQIKALSTTSGYLAKCNVEIPPGLTCIIGARGTCKSTIVESIRFAFDADVNDRIAQLQGAARNPSSSLHGMLESTLGAGTVHCDLIHGDEADPSQITLERELNDPARAYAEGVRDYADTNFQDHIEIYSQGDLQLLSELDSDEMRLNLVDRPNAAKIRIIVNKRTKLGVELKEASEKLRTITTSIREIEQKTKPLDELKIQHDAQLGTMPKLPPDLEIERGIFDRRYRVLQSLDAVPNLLLGIQETISSVSDIGTALAQEIDSAESEQIPEAFKAIDVAKSILNVVGDVASLRSQIDLLEYPTILASLRKTIEENNERYYGLRKEESEIGEALKANQVLRRQIDQIEKLQAGLRELRKEADKITARRSSLRLHIEQLDSELYELRSLEVDNINSEFGDHVLLALSTRADGGPYRTQLEELLEGSRIHAQSELARDIATTIPVEELLTNIENSDTQALADALDRDVGQLNRLLSHLGDHSDLYELDLIQPSIRLEIALYQGGVPKEVESLSKGQRATALLPLILRHYNYPLIFDQPEDDLDNSYIYEFMVKKLRDLKLERQLVFVTHNANIPVLAEADKIIVMEMATPTEAVIAKQGSVDDCKDEILRLLEGGVEAFQKRQERYGGALR